MYGRDRFEGDIANENVRKKIFENLGKIAPICSVDALVFLVFLRREIMQINEFFS